MHAAIVLAFLRDARDSGHRIERTRIKYAYPSCDRCRPFLHRSCTSHPSRQHQHGVPLGIEPGDERQIPVQPVSVIESAVLHEPLGVQMWGQRRPSGVPGEDGILPGRCDVVGDRIILSGRIRPREIEDRTRHSERPQRGLVLIVKGRCLGHVPPHLRQVLLTAGNLHQRCDRHGVDNPVDRQD